MAGCGRHVGAAVLVLGAACAARAAPPLVPAPAEMRELGGTFELTADTVLLSDRASRREAEVLATALGVATGFDLEVATRRVRGRCRARRVRGTCRRWIRLKTARRTKRFGPEGYRLVVRPGGVKIVAGSAAGLFYGGVTLRQLLPPEIFATAVTPDVAWSAPAVRVHDRPRLGWRGMHLDVARSFIPAPDVKRLLDALALHKLNRFHWHLTDDQGWRLPVPDFPALTAVGGWRAETPIRAAPNAGLLNLFLDEGGDAMPTGGAYTAEEIADVVQHAAERHITIVPEVDMPGHMQAALAALPVLRSVPDDLEVATTFGPRPHVVDVGDDALAVLDAIVEAVVETFPGEFIHLGGDEAILAEWETGVDAQARIAELGLAGPEALFGWFVGRMAGVVAAAGRRPIVWNDALRDGLPSTIAVMSWLGQQAGIDAATAGHDVVMTPLGATYFDHAQANPLPAAEQAVLTGRIGPALQAALTTDLEEAYAFQPVPAGLSADAQARILGAQGMVWTEYIRDRRDVERFAFPRLAALAERVWSPAEGRDFDDFVGRLRTHVRRLTAGGVETWPLPAS